LSGSFSPDRGGGLDAPREATLEEAQLIGDQDAEEHQGQLVANRKDLFTERLLGLICVDGPVRIGTDEVEFLGDLGRRVPVQGGDQPLDSAKCPT
jgi:hypothetical protein